LIREDWRGGFKYVEKTLGQKGCRATATIMGGVSWPMGLVLTDPGPF
jgi:hypothetical protein